MTDRAAFVAAIEAAPADDAPPLVYADWLDEHGEPEEAELIRVQVRLGRCRPEERWALFQQEADLHARLALARMNRRETRP